MSTLSTDPLPRSQQNPESLESNDALKKGADLLLSHQHKDGYWWYTLEANETIGSGFIQLMHFLNEVDSDIQSGLVRRMLSQQNSEGSWSVFFEGPGDLSTTIECYFALRLAGHSPSEHFMTRARSFILSQGGLAKVRIFTRIHLALFGMVPWSACPSMPVWLMLLPSWSRASIYEFSTWARASIVPLLLIDTRKPVKKMDFSLDELFCELPEDRSFPFPKPQKLLSIHNFFTQCDKVLKFLDRMPWHPGKKLAIRKAEQWTREHIQRTEDIYPAMAYAVLGLKALGYPNDDPTIRKAMSGLKRFQQRGEHTGSPLHPLSDTFIHQQCCISPNWDTPWAGVALIEAGVSPQDSALLKAGRYLIRQEIREFRGDWKIKNPQGPAGGWSFEFQNDYFPDLDDTIQAICFLKKSGLPTEEIEGPISRGLAWLLSMQSSNGGWAAFDKNNTREWVNCIPFSDHGACLDPPTPDITGRMLELLKLFEYSRHHPAVERGLQFLKETQETCGAWRGRWGVNFIYGTWCVLKGLVSMGEDRKSSRIRKAVSWLESIQNKDGGWGESCLSDLQNQYVPLSQGGTASLGASTPSQTAWAVMGLVAAGERDSIPVRRGIDWLIKNQDDSGGWQELYHTGTGFPGHFYLKYHGYRYYFPVLALALYSKES